MNRAVFLDRDGVLNATFLRAGVSYPPADLGEVQILPGVPAACRALKDAGYLLIVVTNQPDIARGSQTAAGVDAINQFIRSHVPLDDFRVCPHDAADGCDCRKPKPGLLLAAAAAHAIDLAQSFMVGDRASDILAGAAAGCRTLLVDRPYSKKDVCRPDFVVGDLPDAARTILTLANPPRQSR
jgi:D-glycero-D-manno-heptose 1,7-bisphosphate phosphatase